MEGLQFLYFSARSIVCVIFLHGLYDVFFLLEKMHYKIDIYRLKRMDSLVHLDELRTLFQRLFLLHYYVNVMGVYKMVNKRGYISSGKRVYIDLKSQLLGMWWKAAVRSTKSKNKGCFILSVICWTLFMV